MRYLVIVSFALVVGATASNTSFEGEPYSYGGSNDANHWPTLFEDCSRYNPFQSPIDVISGMAVPSTSNVSFNHVSSKFHVSQRFGLPFWSCLVPGDCGSITKNGKQYELLSFHLHTPSENAVNGVSEILELHLVHTYTPPCTGSTAEYLVLGVFVKVIASHNPEFDAFWNSTILSSNDIEVEMDPKVLYQSVSQAGDRLFIFPGSLTAPPCSPGVNWLLLQRPISISEEQVMLFRERALAVTPYGNYRPFQPVNNRKVEVKTF